MSDGPLFERVGRPSSAADGSENRDGGDAGPDIWSVAALNRSVRLSLEAEWGGIWVQGEIADLSRAATGHVYFTLNDEQEAAQLRAVMFRSDARRSRAKLEKGARVRLFGRLSLYEPRGSFQFIAQRAMPAGQGELAAQLRRLIKKLQAEGLTDPDRKRPLPLVPRVVGVVTSEHGAAIHDILRVSRGRCPVRLVLSPCRVQGSEAPAEIVRALERVQRLPDVDVVIVARGGGSAEDLWAFNDEAVARAVAGCRVPVVSGVGHETDVSLTDLVADVRAATPSNAAELVCPEREALQERVRAMERALARAMETQVGRGRVRLGALERELSDPRHRLRACSQQVAQLNERLRRAVTAAVQTRRSQLEQQRRRLSPHSPQARVRRWREQLAAHVARLRHSPQDWLYARRASLAEKSHQLRHAGPQALRERRHALEQQVGKLSALSPLSVLARGYAIALHDETGRAVRSQREVATGDRLTLRLHDGQVGVVVDS